MAIGMLSQWLSYLKQGVQCMKLRGLLNIYSRQTDPDRSVLYYLDDCSNDCDPVTGLYKGQIQAQAEGEEGDECLD